MPGVTFTYDLEDHSPLDLKHKNYPCITRKLMDFLESRDIRSTVFVLGELASESPGLVREIADRGHEIGYHTNTHRHLYLETKDGFRKDTDYCKKLIEDLSGQAVAGFRAPAFSLTPASLWVLDILEEYGFTYSSSILPVKNPINGFPGAPVSVFRWPNGILEFPAPTGKLGPVTFPFLGGIYLRYLPFSLIIYLLDNLPGENSPWIYCHPHDFDHEESFYVIRGTSLLTSLLLWFRRKGTFRKMERLVDCGEIHFHGPFTESIKAGKFRDVPVYHPPEWATSLQQTRNADRKSP